MYAELHSLSSFSFLKGASQPVEMVAMAAELGYAAIAITDECSLAGVVRAHEEAKRRGIQLIVGSELRCEDGLAVVAIARTRQGYSRLSRVITRARRAATKGHYKLTRTNLLCLEECLLLWIPDAAISLDDGKWLRTSFPDCVWIGVELHAGADDAKRLDVLRRVANQLQLPLTASGGAVIHCAERKPLHDVLTAIRLIKPVSECGYELLQNSERRLRSIAEVQAVYPRDLLSETLAIAARCTFSLDELRYEYPRELVPEGHTPTTWLRELTYRGVKER